MKKVILSLAIAGLSLSGDCYGIQNNSFEQRNGERCSIPYTMVAYKDKDGVSKVDDLGDISLLKCVKLYVGAKVDKRKRTVRSAWGKKIETVRKTWEKTKKVADITFVTITASAATAFICYNFPSVPDVVVGALEELALFTGKQSLNLGLDLSKTMLNVTLSSVQFGWSLAEERLGF